MASYLALMFRNLGRNRRRSLLTISSVAVSLSLLTVLIALYRTLFYGGETTAGQALRLVVHHKISLTQDLPVSDEQKIARLPGVRSVTRLRWFGGTYKDANNPKYRFVQFAIEPATLFDVFPEFSIPESQKQAFISEKTACVASQALVDQLGWKLGERITLVGTLIPVNLELKLTGIFEDSDKDSVLYFNWEYLHDSMPASDLRRDLAQQFYVETAGKQVVSDVARQIDALFADSPNPTRSEPEQAFMLSFASFLGNLKLFLAAIAGAVTFTILLISANMLSMSVRERTREVGILKTLGFTPSEIMAMIAGEASLIALAGGVIGCAVAGGLCAAIAALVRGAPGFAFVIRGLTLSPLAVVLTLSISLLIGLASSLIPGLNAARTSILDALRYSG